MFAVRNRIAHVLWQWEARTGDGRTRRKSNLWIFFSFNLSTNSGHSIYSFSYEKWCLFRQFPLKKCDFFLQRWPTPKLKTPSINLKSATVRLFPHIYRYFRDHIARNVHIENGSNFLIELIIYKWTNQLDENFAQLFWVLFFGNSNFRSAVRGTNRNP